MAAAAIPTEGQAMSWSRCCSSWARPGRARVSDADGDVNAVARRRHGRSGGGRGRGRGLRLSSEGEEEEGHGQRRFSRVIRRPRASERGSGRGTLGRSWGGRMRMDAGKAPLLVELTDHNGAFDGREPHQQCWPGLGLSAAHPRSLHDRAADSVVRGRPALDARYDEDSVPSGRGPTIA